MFPFEFPSDLVTSNELLIIAVLVMTAVNFAMGVFWIAVGWRLMRAHERMPDVLASALSQSASHVAPKPELPGGI